jgi:hypothetical protein
MAATRLRLRRYDDDIGQKCSPVLRGNELPARLDDLYSFQRSFASRPVNSGLEGTFLRNFRIRSHSPQVGT